MSAVELHGVRKSFGEEEVLHGIDLEVEEHQVVCLIGASGSGKSTFLRCVNLLEPIDEGGSSWGRGGDRARRRRRPGAPRIGIVFQAYNLFPHMTVLRNVTLAPRGAREVEGGGRG